MGGAAERDSVRVDRKERGNGEEGFRMPGWTYFSRATPGHPASIDLKQLIITMTIFYTCQSVLLPISPVGNKSYQHSRRDILSSQVVFRP